MDIYPNSEISDEIEKYDIKTVKHKIYHSPTARDEDEYIEKVVSTSTMSRDETEKLRLICRAIEVFHLGKWTCFISKYCKKEYSLNYSDFYEKLFNYAWEQEKSSKIKLAISEGFIKLYNHGCTTHFEGQFSPFGVHWSSTFFSKELFTWLCIAYFKDQIYRDIETFLNNILPKDWNKEIVKYNKSLIFSHDYNPEKGEILKFDFNWHDYFHKHSSLKKTKNSLFITDKFVGRSHEQKTIDPKDLNWLRWAAGGRSYFLQRQNSYTYQKMTCKYEKENQENLN